MKQFILKKEPDKNNTVRLDGDDYHYLVRVRRLAVGECFPALLPNGSEVEILIKSINGKILTGDIKGAMHFNAWHPQDSLDPSSPSVSFVPSPNLRFDVCVNSSCKIILFQALPKADKMDLIVRQAAEGGIAEIVPFVSEFSVAKTKADGQKFTRWERIIKEARQQSGSKIATALHSPLTINELFNYWKAAKEKSASAAEVVGLIFHHQSVIKSPLAHKSLHGYLNSNPGVVALVIGPEGGFSDAEVSLFMENGFNPIMIGDTVLRTETAALYCAAAIRTILLEKDSWELKKT